MAHTTRAPVVAQTHETVVAQAHEADGLAEVDDHDEEQDHVHRLAELRELVVLLVAEQVPGEVADRGDLEDAEERHGDEAQRRQLAEELETQVVALVGAD